MKKLIFLILTLILLNLSLVSAEEVFIEESSLRIDLISITPSPIQKGEDFDLIFKLENFGNENIIDLNVEIAEKFPFSSRRSEPALRKIPVLKSGSSEILNFRMEASDNSKIGSDKISLEIYALGFSKTYPATFDVNIVDIKNIISINKIITKPERIIPGKESKLLFNLENNGQFAMREISVKLDFSDVPITPILSTNERRVSKLGIGERIELNFDLIADADTESKAYKIPISLTFYDLVGNKISKNDTIGILVYSEPEFQVNLEDSKVYKKGDTGEIVISVSNDGPADIKFLTLELLESKDYDIISAKNIYLGNLDSDDFETTEFDVNIKESDDILLKFKISYKDSYNQEFDEQRIVVLPVYKGSKAVKYGLSKPSGISKTIFWILLIIYIYLVYMAWRRKKDLPTSLKTALKELIKGILSILKYVWPGNWKKLIKNIKTFLK